MNDMAIDTRPATAAFDAAAGVYDAAFSFSQTGMLQRQRVHHFLQKHIAALKGSSVLELNCGTGEDALWMAGQGCVVTATDQSAGMIAQLKDKLQAAPGPEVLPMQCAFDELAQKIPLGKYPFVLSNFGGLNCISPGELAALAATLYHITAKEALLALVVMSKKCWWEQLYYRLKGNRQAAKRRQSNGPVNVSFGSSTLPVWYYHPADIEKAFSAGFTKLYQKPVGFFLPPSYMEGYFKKHKTLLKLLYGLEKLFAHFSWQVPCSDHYLIVLKRKE
jgi:SAM-dependent methyltransferase